MELAAAVPWALLTWGVSALGFLCLRPLWTSWTDQGYGIAKVVGPLLVGCAAWLLVGNAALPLSATTASVACAVIALVAAAVTWRHRHAPLPAWRHLLTIDIVWIASLCAFGLIRAWSPSIAGAERPMDHALLAALLQQQVVPPTDPWLAGFPVNYHYVGHALWTPLGLLSGQPPWLVYNLVLVTLPAQTLVAAWSLGRRLHAGWAWIGAAALVLAGPFAVALDAARHWRVPGPHASTRVIPDTINEFPFFSLTWGDLHAHVIALPLLVGVAGALIRLDEHVQGQARRALVVPTTMLVALLGSAAVLTSTWDAVPIAIAASCTALLLTRAPAAIGVAALVGGAVTVAAMALPALVSFRPPPVASGWEWHGSPLGSFLLVQGGWLLPAALLCLTHERRGPLVVTAALVAAAAWLVPGMAARVLLLALAVGIWRQREVLGRGATVLTLSAIALLMIAECVWVDDVYGWQYRRMNTVFKWQLHATVLLTLAWPRLLPILWSNRSRRIRGVQMLVRCALVGLALVSAASTLLVLASRYREREPVRTLNGLAGLTRNHTGDAAAIAYLWQEGAPQDVVLEAVGQSYTYGARISTMTGHPTLLGWRGHEHLWRRGPEWRRVIDERARLVNDLYAGPVEGLQTRVQAAGVRYVVIGAVERRRYAGITADRFAGVADTVSDTGGTVLLRVR
jgi:YYY domain-containing protein